MDLEKHFEFGRNWHTEYLSALGSFEIVYSWGVLHHTGNMWKALENAAIPVKKNGGVLVIALYNDQGKGSERWKIIKKCYNRFPGPLKVFILIPCFVRIWGITFIRDLLKLQPFRTWKEYRENRGMSPWHDVIDWVGGYPFEVAKPEDVIEFYKKRGIALKNAMLCGHGSGNNEFVFLR